MNIYKTLVNRKTEESQLEFFLKFKKEVAHHLILN